LSAGGGAEASEELGLSEALETLEEPGALEELETPEESGTADELGTLEELKTAEDDVLPSGSDRAGSEPSPLSKSVE